MLYVELFRALADHQVRYLLVGGLAMNLHGVPRMTMDVDLILAMDEENLDHFITCAKTLGLSPVAPVSLNALKDAKLRQQWVEEKHLIAFGLQNNAARIPILVDILIAPNIDIQAAFQRAIIRNLDGVPLTLASVEDMTRLKSGTGRAQDESDIEHLERLRDR